MANVLANIFGSSPVRPLEKHIGIAFSCAKQLKAFFAAAVKGDWAKATAVRAEIERLEHKADDLKKQIRLGLPKSLFMPVPREDLLELLLVQDKIANRTKDVSGIVVGRKMQIPAQIADPVHRICRAQYRCGQASEEKRARARRVVYRRLSGS